MKFILSIFMLVFFSYEVKSATTVQLESVLQKYGVPKASDCGTINEAHYNGSAPECQEWGMFYDTQNRRCDYCEIGYKTNSKTDIECVAIVCPAGYTGNIINDGKCPTGYILQQITGGSCPVGNVLTEM